MKKLFTLSMVWAVMFMNNYAIEAPNNLKSISFKDSLILTWDSVPEATDGYYIIYKANFRDTLQQDSIGSVTMNRYKLESYDYTSNSFFRIVAVNNAFQKSKFSEYVTACYISAIPSFGLVAWYQFNGNANDAAGGNNTGTVSGATLTPDKDGVVDQAYHFPDGSYILHPTTGMNPRLGSFIAWIKPLNSTDLNGIWQTHDGGDNYVDWFSIFDSYGTFIFRVGDGSYCCSNDVQINTQTYFPVNSWTHLAVTWEGTTMQVFANGVLVAKRNNVNLQDTMDPLARIGYAYNSFKGSMDEVAIYNRVITEGELTEIANNSNVNETIDFGVVEKGTTVTKTYFIYNNSGETIEISSIENSNPMFTLDKTSFTINPNSYDSIQISFLNANAGEISDTLYIWNNGPLRKLILKASSVTIPCNGGAVIADNTTWTKANSPYHLTCNIAVAEGVILTIEPGVKVFLDAGIKLIVDGTIVANGTVSDSIHFISFGVSAFDRIQLRSAVSSEFNYFTVTNAASGVQTEGTAQVTIQNGSIKNCSYGIELHGGTSNISALHIMNCSSYGVYADGGTTGSVAGSTITKCSSGIYFSGVYMDATENISTLNTQYGLYVSTGYGKTFSTNTITNNGYGIYGYDNLTIENNTVSNNTNYGINAYNSRLYSNTINSNGGNGIEWDNNTIQGNIVKNNGGNGISTNASVITGNSVNSNSQHGLNVSGCTITENQIVSNTQNGINCTGFNIIENNRITDNHNHGIYDVSNSNITCNDILRNTKDGIYANGSLPIVNNNNIFGNIEHELHASLTGTSVINAENNFWGVSTIAEIRAKTYDYYDNTSLIKIDFEPFVTSEYPLEPVKNFKAEILDNQVKLSWSAEPRASQYILYHDNQSHVLDTTSVWITIDSTFTSLIPSLSEGEYVFGIQSKNFDGRVSKIAVAYCNLSRSIEILDNPLLFGAIKTETVPSDTTKTIKIRNSGNGFIRIDSIKTILAPFSISTVFPLIIEKGDTLTIPVTLNKNTAEALKENKGYVYANTDNKVSISNFTYLGKLGVKTYYVSNDAANWQTAWNTCQSLGGHLVDLNSKEENTFVSGLLNSGNWYWTSLTDEGSEGSWKWNTGLPLLYSSWSSGEPNDGSSYNYAVMNNLGKWFDAYIWSGYYYILEIDDQSYPITFKAELRNRRAEISLSTDTLNFGVLVSKVFSDTTQSFWLKNNGDGSLIIDSITAGTNLFEINYSGNTVNPDDSMQVLLTIRSTETIGKKDCDVKIYSNAFSFIENSSVYCPLDANLTDIVGNNIVLSDTLIPSENNMAQPNRALYFNGSNPVMIQSSDAFSFGTNDFTISFDFTLDNIDRIHDGLIGRNDYQGIAIDYNHDGDRRMYIFIDANGSYYWDFTWKPEKYDWVANQWYNLILMRQNNVLKFYIDGVLIGSSDITISINNPTDVPFYVGRSQLTDRIHTGKIDEFRVINRSISDTEIQKISRSNSNSVALLATVREPVFAYEIVPPFLNFNDVRVSRYFDTSKTAYVKNKGETVMVVDSITSIGKPFVGNSTQPVSIQVDDSIGINVTLKRDTTVGLYESAMRIYSNGFKLIGKNDKYISWYPFDGDAKDKGVSGNDGTVHGATLTTDRFGRANSAYLFNGSGDYIQIADPQNLPLGNSPRTLACWFKPASANGVNPYMTMFSYGTPLNNSELYSLEFYTQYDYNRPVLIGWNTDTWGPYYQAYNQWYYLVSTFDGTTSSLYLNGELVATNSLTFNTVLNGDGILIGYITQPNDGNHGYFKGVIDDITLYNRALTSGEVLENMNTETAVSLLVKANLVLPSAPKNLKAQAGAGVIALRWDSITDSSISKIRIYRGVTSNDKLAVLLDSVDSSISSYNDSTIIQGKSYYYWVTSNDTAGYESFKSIGVTNISNIPVNGLVAYYTFNENTKDVSGNELNASAINNPIYSMDRFGNTNSGLFFDGGNKYVETPVINSSDTFSVSLWVRPNELQNMFLLYDYESNYHCNGNGLRIEQNGQIVSDRRQDYYWSSITTSFDAYIISNVWNHIVISVSDGIANVYLNGRNVGSSGFNVRSNRIWKIGDPYNCYGYINGTIDDIAFYSKALTNVDVQKLLEGYPSRLRTIKNIQFGPVANGGIYTKELPIHNIDNTFSLDVSNMAFEDSKFTINKSAVTLAGGGSEVETVTFAPTILGKVIDTLVISTDDPNVSEFKVAVEGYATSEICAIGGLDSIAVWTKANSPYHLTCDYTVTDSGFLTIEPGVEVFIDSGKKIMIDGKLIASGTIDDKIQFIGNEGKSFEKIQFRNSTGSILDNFIISNVNFGIQTEGSSNLMISNGVIMNAQYGMQLNNGQIQVDSVSIISCSNYGIYAENGVTGSIKNSYVTNANNGVYATNCGLDIIGNEITQNNQYGIYINYGNHKIVANNTVLNNDYGIYGYNNINIENNIVSNSSYFGISANSSSILSNTVTNNTGNGIEGNYNTINTNIIVNNGANGVSSYGSTIEGNIVNGNIDHGLYVSGCTIKDNQIVNNHKNGINSYSSDCVIEGNRITDNLENGIYDVSNSAITYNEILRNIKDGIYCDGGMPIVHYNNIMGNKEHEIHVTRLSSETLDATDNFWGATTLTAIKAVTYDYTDNANVIKINYSPFRTTIYPISAVENFKANIVNGKTVLSWKVSPNASRYLLYNDNKSRVIDTTSVLTTVDSTTTTYIPSVAEGEYIWGIRAQNFDGRTSSATVAYTELSRSINVLNSVSFGTVYRDSMETDSVQILSIINNGEGFVRIDSISGIRPPFTFGIGFPAFVEKGSTLDIPIVLDRTAVQHDYVQTGAIYGNMDAQPFDNVNFTNIGTYDGYGFYASNYTRNWTDAKNECISLGGRLASIHSAGENDFIASRLPNDNYYWIGFTDELSEGNWVWENGDEINFTSWASGKPNQGTWGNYALMHKDGTWEDYYWSYGYYFIMKKKVSASAVLSARLLDPQPILSISTDTINMGEHRPNRFSDMFTEFTISNNGVQQLIVDSITGLTGPFSTSLNMPATIAANDSLKVPIKLEMSSSYGNYNNYLSIHSNAKISEQPTGAIDGLVGYYPFNNNVLDVSDNKHNGIVTSPSFTTDRFGHAKSAYLVNGKNIELENTSALDFKSGGFTLMAWVYPTAYNDDKSVIGKHTPGYSGGYFLGIYDDYASFYVANDWRITSANKLEYNKWYQLVGVFNDSVQKLYLNGKLLSSRNWSYTNYSSSPVVIGGINGKVDDVMIFSRPLSDEDIRIMYKVAGIIDLKLTASIVPPAHPQSCNAVFDGSQVTLTWDSVADPTIVRYKIYRGNASDTLGAQVLDSVSNSILTYSDNSLLPGGTYFYWVTAVDTAGNESYFSLGSTTIPNIPANGLLAYYPLNGNTNDASGNNMNAVTYNGNEYSHGRWGELNSGFRFNGTNNYIETPVINSTDTFSVSLWIKPVTLQNMFLFYNYESSYYCKGNGLKIGPNGQIILDRRPDYYWSSNNTYLDAYLTPTVWNNIVLSVNNGLATVYLDGKKVGTSTFDVKSISTWKIGDPYNYQGYISGTLDDVMVFNTALNADDVKKIVNDYPSRLHVDSRVLFGSVTNNGTYSKQLYIYNTDTINNLNVSSLQFKEGAFSLNKTNLQITGGSLDSVQITFNPTTLGYLVDTLVIESDDPGSPELKIVVEGFSTTNICQAVLSGQQVWTKENSPYAISCNLSIDAGSSLTINPGVTVIIDPNVKFNINGTLKVNGTKQEPVTFTNDGAKRFQKLYFSSGSFGSFNHTFIKNADTAIYAKGATIIASNVDVKDCYTAFDLDASGLTADSLDIIVASYGIHGYNGANGFIGNSSVTYSGSGIYCDNSFEVINCNLLYNNGYGLYIGNAEGKIISGNNVSYNKSNGGNVGNSKSVTNNRFIDNSGTGINISNVSDFSNNIITGNKNNGIEAQSSNLQYNIIENNANNGIMGNYNTIKHNTIQGNGQNGIIGYNGTIGMNAILNNGLNGLQMDQSDIRENDITGNLANGIKCSSYNTIYGNKISGNMLTGIYEQGNCQITYNDIVDNKEGGIHTISVPVINYNNILIGEGGYLVSTVLQSSDVINAHNNNWGTSDSLTIANLINDYYDNGVTVKVEYWPFEGNKIPLFPVSGFTATSETGGNLNLTWDLQPKATQYLIYNDNGTGTVDSANTTAVVESSTLTYTSLFPDGYYKFGIRAIDNYGNKSNLSFSYGKSDGTPPSMLAAKGGQFDTTLLVSFSENIPFDAIKDIGNWSLSSNIAIKDIRRDGKNIALVADNVVKIYKNEGPKGFTLLQDSLVTGTSKVAVGDINNDGRLDMVFFKDNYYVYEYKNIGTNTKPEFVAGQDSINYYWSGYNARTTLADLDGDGDLDLFTNDNYNCYYYYNTGSLSVPNWNSQNYLGWYWDSYGPSFADIDGDGDFDLFIGNYNNIRFFENTGDRLNPSFSYITDSYLPQSINGPCYPTFIDIDSDGDMDLFVGGYHRMYFFENTGDVRNPKWVLRSENYGGLATNDVNYSITFFNSKTSGIKQNQVQLVLDQPLPDQNTELTLTNTGAYDVLLNKSGLLTLNLYPDDGNENPELSMTNLPGEVNGDITIGYFIVDEEKDNVNISPRYSIDGGNTWKIPTITGDTLNLDSSRYIGNIIWHTGTDFPSMDVNNVLFKITPKDNDPKSFGTPGISSLFSINNNFEPELALIHLFGEQKNTVAISYTVTDAEGDQLKLKCEYFDADKSKWLLPSITGDTLVYSGSGIIYWHTLTDLPTTADMVMFRITPYDTEMGIGDTSEFILDNIGVSSASISKLFTEKLIGDVEIPYQLADDERDTLDLVAEYSSDGGASWNNATVTGNISDIDSLHYIDFLVWQTNTDFTDQDVTNVKFRITPFDANKGITTTIDNLHVDNNDLPVLTINNSSGDKEDININFSIVDMESDKLDINVYYEESPDNWKLAWATGELRNTSNYNSSFIWVSDQDLPEGYGTYRLAVVPSDNDQGVGDTIEVAVYNKPIIDIGEDTAFCHGNSLWLHPNGSFSRYEWYRDGYLISSNYGIYADTTGTYTLTVYNRKNGAGSDSRYVFVQEPYSEQITAVTFDMVSKSNSIIWNKTSDKGTKEYKIYREGDGSIYNIMATVPYDSVPVYIDKEADPEAQGYRYKITTVDTCGGESALSNAHRTVALSVVQSSSNYKLDWNLPEGNTIYNIRILRGNSPDNLTPLSTVLSTSAITWTDVSAPACKVYYQVQFDLGVSYNMNGSDYQYVYSNIGSKPNCLEPSTPEFSGSRFLCSGTSQVTVSATNASVFTWNDSYTNQVRTFGTSDVGKTFTVTAKSACGCTALSPELTIENSNSAIINLGADTTICQGDTIVLDAGIGFIKYTWTSGVSSDKQTVKVFSPGTYSVTAYAGSGTNCPSNGSINISVVQKPALSLPESLVFCSNATLLIDAGAGYNSYTWSTGSTTRVITVNEAGKYEVEVTDGNNCKVKDATVVTSGTVPAQVVLRNDTTVCKGNSIQLTASGGFYSYLWNTGAETASLSVDATGNYIVKGFSNDGCFTSDSVLITVVTPFEGESICLVTIDPETSKNLIVWERTANKGIASYNIYKETDVADEYDILQNVVFSELSVFVDNSSMPATRSERYKISVIDTCGNESVLSPNHKTMHLTINTGVGGAFNLIWENYEGFSFGSYTIFRGTAIDNMEQLTTIPSNITTYTDDPPVGTYYYQVVIVLPFECAPAITNRKAGAGPFSEAVSNIEKRLRSTTAVHLAVSGLSVYPNPVDNYIILNNQNKVVQNALIEVYRMDGSLAKQVSIKSLELGEFELDISGLAKANYLLKLTGDGIIFTEPIVKQ